MSLLARVKGEVPLISMVGLLAMSIVFGWVRYGYGLLLPDFQADFHLSKTTLGMISSLSFLSFLVGALLVTFFIAKWGPKMFIVSGLAAASVGLLTAAFAQSGLLFSIGCVIAGLCPGLCWAPFSESVSNYVRERLQKRSLAVISTGSSIGLVVICALYLVFPEGSWRLLWIIGGIIGLVLLLVVLKTVPSGAESPSPHDIKRPRLPSFHKHSVHLFTAAIIFGVTEATYWTYAADFAEQSFHMDASNALFFLITGVGGIAGLWAGELINYLGFRKSFFLTVLVYALSMFILFVSQSWAAIGLSGFLFGLTFMMYAAFLPIWSAEVFPNAPAQGFSISVVILNMGTIIGPAFFGGMLTVTGYKWIFLLAAMVACSKLFLAPTEER
ncbi:MFS transporter [Lentibacillus halophilus]|uniref:MFS transporter n=1 Tax=Lentibacillus halophilus TaxID=295065 RepID=A0ABN0ZHA3_9BACI